MLRYCINLPPIFFFLSLLNTALSFYLCVRVWVYVCACVEGELYKTLEVDYKPWCISQNTSRLSSYWTFIWVF